MANVHGYKSWEQSISVATTFDVLTDLKRTAQAVVIRCDAAVSVKFNSSSNDAITISAVEKKLEIPFADNLLINSIIVTPSTSANVKILVW